MFGSRRTEISSVGDDRRRLNFVVAGEGCVRHRVRVPVSRRRGSGEFMGTYYTYGVVLSFDTLRNSRRIRLCEKPSVLV